MAHWFFQCILDFLCHLDAIYGNVDYDILSIVNLKLYGALRLKILMGWLYLILFDFVKNINFVFLVFY